MPTFSASVEAFWHAPLVRGEVLYRAGALTIVSDPELADDRRVMIVSTGAGTIAALSPAMAARVLVRPVRDEPELRAALADADVPLHPADAVFYVPLAGKVDLLREPGPASVRRLTERDADAFEAFASAMPPQDLDDAYVELEHWAVFGAFHGEKLACAASMYPWEGSDLADLGVVTLPEFRGQGLARAVVRESCRYAYSQDHEPQYRCQLDNTASRALAASAGLAWFANWEVVSPEPPA